MHSAFTLIFFRFGLTLSNFVGNISSITSQTYKIRLFVIEKHSCQELASSFQKTIFSLLFFLEIIVLDVRYPCTPCVRLNEHRGCVNGLCWAPHSSCHITVRLRGILTFFQIPMVNFSQNIIHILSNILVMERKVRSRWRQIFQSKI